MQGQGSGAGDASRRRGWPTGLHVRESLSNRGLEDSDISDSEIMSDQLRAI